MHSFKVGSTYSSLKTHAIRKHPNWQDELENITNDSTLEPSPMETDQGSFDISTNHSTTQTVDTSSYTDPADGQSTICIPSLEGVCESGDKRLYAKRTAALFLLTFKERYKLPQASINFAVGAINGIVSSVGDSIQQSLKRSIDTSAITAEEISTHFEHEDPFASLQTEYQQSKFYRDEFGLVVSCALSN